MITRPLDLAARLRPEPRSFDAVFLVNGGLLVLFFYLLGSSFVLAPGVSVGFQMPELPGARNGAIQTTHRITVKPSGLIFTDDGPADLEQLGKWLTSEAKKTRQPSLLIIASVTVQWGTLAEIAKTAKAAGFMTVHLAAEEPTAAGPAVEGR
jgi:biopolymer transport protein ExbD